MADVICEQPLSSSKRNNLCAEWSRGNILRKNKGRILFYCQASLTHADVYFQVGNYVEKFDLSGNYQGEWPGWYNWPDEMVGQQKIKFPNVCLKLKANFPRWWVLGVSWLCQLLARWTTTTCSRPVSSHTGRLSIQTQFAKKNSRFSSDGKFKHGFHKSSTGLSK